MRTPALQERRNRQILARCGPHIYRDQANPCRRGRFRRVLGRPSATATIRNVMVELEDGGFLTRPHTSAGRVPPPRRNRFFAQEIASSAAERCRQGMDSAGIGAATNASEVTERAGHVLPKYPMGLALSCRADGQDR